MEKKLLNRNGRAKNIFLNKLSPFPAKMRNKKDIMENTFRTLHAKVVTVTRGCRPILTKFEICDPGTKAPNPID